MLPADLQTLGLKPGATEKEIRRAYRKLAREHHPDLAGASHKARFQEIHAAYARLLPRAKVEPSAAADERRHSNAKAESVGGRAAEAFMRDLGSTFASKGAEHARKAVAQQVKRRGKFAQACGAFFSAAIEEGEELLQETLRGPK